jgi:hypothetical protein
MDDEIGYLSSRALAELDQARRCADAHAARGHLELAEQHLERMRRLCRIGDGPASPSAAAGSGAPRPA